MRLRNDDKALGYYPRALIGFAAAAPAPGPALRRLRRSAIGAAPWQDPHRGRERSVAALAVRGNSIVASERTRRSMPSSVPHPQHSISPALWSCPHHRCAYSSGARLPGPGKCSLEQALTPAEVKARVAKMPQEQPGDATQWFRGRVGQPLRPDAELADLDSILASRPMIFSGSDGHTAWANSAVLALARITAATQDPRRSHRRGRAASPPELCADTAAKSPMRRNLLGSRP